MADETQHFSNIVCAVDGSENGRRAARVASTLAARFSAKLTFLTVAKELKVSAQVRHYMQIEHLSGEPQYVLDQHTESVLDEVKSVAEGAGVRSFKTEIKTGNPARTIVAYAERAKADCIVLGSRGLGEIEGLLLGSVSHKVTSLAKCTCVTVR